MPEHVVLLHGFGGTRRTWDAVAAQIDRERYIATAVDLPGHGAAAGEGAVTFEKCVRHVLDAAPERFALCGYSLGGRAALHVALAAPARVSRLVLVSAGAGIEDPAERAARRASDEELARRLETGPFDDFIAFWNAQELFAGDPEPVRALASADLRRNAPARLAASLRGLGAGTMEPLWDRLGELSMPVRVVAGARDARYVAIAQRMAGLLAQWPGMPHGAPEPLVLDGGHRLALESPDALARAIVTGPTVSRTS